MFILNILLINQLNNPLPFYLVTVGLLRFKNKA